MKKKRVAIRGVKICQRCAHLSRSQKPDIILETRHSPPWYMSTHGTPLHVRLLPIERRSGTLQIGGRRAEKHLAGVR